MKRHIERITKHGKRVLTAIVGGLVVLLGVILIPYPGPGWLIVFAGFAILATEFEFAAKTLDWLKERYERWFNWLKRQKKPVRWLVLVSTGLVIVVTVWLLNGPGLINNLLNLHQDWLVSPFFRK